MNALAFAVIVLRGIVGGQQKRDFGGGFRSGKHRIGKTAQIVEKSAVCWRSPAIRDADPDG